ncbi:hypothetical protein ABZX85_19685 [Streptomyces sp. NPDC004539]|uniref:hypothetical protein n=1 Tax=Streptomyces sp. NPDC004539 TaxID=3154280 RepID=UPI0033A1D453
MSTQRGEVTPGWEQPTPLGYGHGAKEAQFVAAPLLAAASLGLAGVVAGAKDEMFLFSGPTLLVLVLSTMSLIYSIQLAYHARKFLYSKEDVLDWYGHDLTKRPELFARLRAQQGDDYATWVFYNNKAMALFNVGTVLLGFGVAAALAPGKDSGQKIWRWGAAVIVLGCTFYEIYWQRRLRLGVARQARHTGSHAGQGGT